MRHTPGPWAVNPTGDIGPWYVGTQDEGIADCDLGFCGAEEFEANARLIAAAPDLLEACERLMRDYPDKSNSTAIEAIRAAIAKATETP